MQLVLTRQIFLRYGGYALVVLWIYTFSIPTYRVLENVLLGRYYYFDDLPFYFFAFCIAPIIFENYLEALDSSSQKTENSKVKLIALWIYLWIVSGLLLFFGLINEMLLNDAPQVHLKIKADHWRSCPLPV